MMACITAANFFALKKGSASGNLKAETELKELIRCFGVYTFCFEDLTISKERLGRGSFGEVYRVSNVVCYFMN